MNKLLTYLLPLLIIFSCSGTSGSESDENGAPAVPTGVEIQDKTSTSVTMKWNASDGADSYEWRLKNSTTTVDTGSTSNTNVVIDGLSAGNKYFFFVRALRGSEASAYSVAVTIDFGEAVVEDDDDDDNPTVAGAICTDAPLVLSLSSTPVLGSEGYIKVFDSSDTQVDAINLADLANVTIREDGQMIPKEKITTDTPFNTTMDAVKCGSRWRIIHYTPLRIQDKALEIKLHSGVLNFGTEYYVTMDAGVIKDHKGIAKGEWTFTTKAKPSSTSELNVAADGSADFCTVQGAASYAATLGKTAAVTVYIAAGTYKESVYIREKNALTLKGASRSSVCIEYANNESYEGGSGGASSSKPQIGAKIGTSGGRGMILIESCDGLVFQDITMKNTFNELKGQAEVMYFNSSSGNLTIENCEMHSYQDTFLCKGKVWVHNSLIAGHCDFVWGYPEVCLFEDCEIRAMAPGYIVQARVPSASNKGFVFLNCKLTAADGVKDGSMYLARSAGQSDCFDNLTFVNCSMSSVIASSGWYTDPAPNPSTPTATSGWKEYGSKDANGKTLNTSSRSKYGRILTADEAAAYLSKEAVLGK